MFTLYGDGGVTEAHDTQDAALTSARRQQLEAFEVRDEARDVQVFVEYPRPTWV